MSMTEIEKAVNDFEVALVTHERGNTTHEEVTAARDALYAAVANRHRIFQEARRLQKQVWSQDFIESFKGAGLEGVIWVPSEDFATVRSNATHANGGSLSYRIERDFEYNFPLVPLLSHQKDPAAPIPRCKHPHLDWQSGGFYIACKECGAQWVARGPASDTDIDHTRSDNLKGDVAQPAMDEWMKT